MKNAEKPRLPRDERGAILDMRPVWVNEICPSQIGLPPRYTPLTPASLSGARIVMDRASVDLTDKGIFDAQTADTTAMLQIFC